MPGKPWTPQEDAELVRSHQDDFLQHGRSRAAMYPNRGEPRDYARYGSETITELASRIGRTPAAVYRRCRQLGLRRYRTAHGSRCDDC